MRRAAVVILMAPFLGCSEQAPPAAVLPSPVQVAAPSQEPALTSVSFCCGSDSMAVGATRQVEARATLADGTITDITSQVTTWRSSSEQVARISSSGVVTGVAAGSTELSFSYRGLEGRWSFRVTSGNEPALSKVWLCCGSDQVGVGTTRQIQARATLIDGTITDITSQVTTWRSSNEQAATISSSGVVTGLTAGATVLSFTYGGLEGTWPFRVTQSFLRPPAADEITGYVQEMTVYGVNGISKPELEYEGRTVVASSEGFFRISGLQTPGLPLLVRKTGYLSVSIAVPELGRELAPIVLRPEPTLVSDFLEGAVCFPTRTITNAFTPTVSGLFRITSHSGVSATLQLFADGVLLSTTPGDLQLSAGVHYELRATGVCDYTPTPLRATFLRPR